MRIAYCVLRIAYGVLLIVLKVKFNVTLYRAISIDLAAGVHHGLIIFLSFAFCFLVFAFCFMLWGEALLLPIGLAETMIMA